MTVLADFGIEFTILAPWQARTNDLDTSEPYWVNSPGGRKMAVFFYHGHLSGRVSFEEGISMNADSFARHELLNSFNPEKLRRNEPQLLLIATDGELYGHHKSNREYFLQHLTNGASSSQDITNTFPALWLRENPPRRSIPLNYDTSWSCYHGLQRWSTGCGCTPGDTCWKLHLREAMNRIAAAIDEVYFDYASRLVRSPGRCATITLK